MYTPQFSDVASISVRRLAWAMGANMPVAVNRMVKLLPAMFNASQVCLACKDKTKCTACIFSQQVNEQDKAALLAL
jgi:hypothetical protein